MIWHNQSDDFNGTCLSRERLLKMLVMSYNTIRARAYWSTCKSITTLIKVVRKNTITVRDLEFKILGILMIDQMQTIVHNFDEG